MVYLGNLKARVYSRTRCHIHHSHRSFSWDALSLALLDKDGLLLKRLEITEIKIN